MNKPEIDIKKTHEMAAEMESSLSYFKTFIANMERLITSINVATDRPAAPHLRSEMYSLKTLATELGVSERTVRRYCDEGLIRYLRLRGKIRFTAKDVADFYERNYRERF